MQDARSRSRSPSPGPRRGFIDLSGLASSSSSPSRSRSRSLSPPPRARAPAPEPVPTGAGDYRVRLAPFAARPAHMCVVRGAGSFYVLCVVDAGSHWLAHALSAHDAAPMCLADYGAHLVSKASTVPALPALVAMWRGCNARAAADTPAFDTLAWLLALAAANRDGGRLPDALDLDAYAPAIDAYMAARA